MNLASLMHYYKLTNWLFYILAFYLSKKVHSVNANLLNDLAGLTDRPFKISYFIK